MKCPHLRWRFWSLTSCILAIFSYSSTLWAQAAPENLRPIAAILHAHSNWSTGTQSLDDLIRDSRAMGAEAIFLIENHLLKFEYGLPPLRGLIRYQKTFPSLLTTSAGPEEYLRAVADANARQKDVLLLPGVEVIPQYYWTGDLFDGTLTMFNGQKNLLVFGLTRPEDIWQLPVTGNYAASHWNFDSLWLLSPALLVVAGIALIRARRTRVVRLTHFQIREKRRLAFPGFVCLGIGVALLINNYPFRNPPFSPYDADTGLHPHQTVIDYVNARGGAVVWSMPEARDHQVVTVGSLKATIHTDTYPSDLLATDRFSAFGGIYDDTTTFTNPGSGWDQLLLAFLNGRRSAPAWAVGEGAYHSKDDAGKRFGEIQTVFFSERKDPQSLLQALRAGRMYALRRTDQESLILAAFDVRTATGPIVVSGGRLALSPPEWPRLRVLLTSLSGAPLTLDVRVIRSGQVVHTTKGQTPLTISWMDDPLSVTAKQFYRIEARGAGHHILSNPIFVTAQGTS